MAVNDFHGVASCLAKLTDLLNSRRWSCLLERHLHTMLEFHKSKYLYLPPPIFWKLSGLQIAVWENTRAKNFLPKSMFTSLKIVFKSKHIFKIDMLRKAGNNGAIQHLILPGSFRYLPVTLPKVPIVLKNKKKLPPNYTAILPRPWSSRKTLAITR